MSKTVTRGDAHIHVYQGEAAGEAGRMPLVLVHGFASDHVTNWVGPGWIAPLEEAGFAVFAPDMRGHGKSTAIKDTTKFWTNLYLNRPGPNFNGYISGGPPRRPIAGSGTMSHIRRRVPAAWLNWRSLRAELRNSWIFLMLVRF
mgnify:CR=1 FL=1